MKTFKELGLNSEIMKGLKDLEFTEPSPVQEKAIPFILKSKKDLIALAQTGTGKTAAFGLPILNQLKSNEKDLKAIIICPTRELCIQISQDIKKFAKYSKNISVTPVYGGERIEIQIKSLKRGANIVVGTPGRVHDLIRRKILKLQDIRWLVLDEADEMLDMGFKEDLDAVLEQIPKTKQTLLFSATISKSVHSIAKKYMKEAEEISVGEKNVGAENVSHEYYIVQTRDRFEALKRILDYLPGVYGILFCRTKRETQLVADKLKAINYNAEALHGDISQNMRTKIMDRFKKKQVHLLVATDVAARGIDVNDLSHVINYNLPDQNEGYTHRSGRTGRAQKSGVSISIITSRDVRTIKRLEKIIGKDFEYKKVPTEADTYKKQIDNFINKMENTDIKAMGNEQNFSDIMDKLKKINKEDLIKYFIANKFSHFASDSKDTRDLNASVKNSGEGRGGDSEVKLKINIGRLDGFDIKGLFSLINSNKHLKGIEIGAIKLMPDHTYFSVEAGRADDIILYLQKNKYKSKEIILTKSSTKASYRGKRRNRSNRSFAKKRKNFRKRR